jgi:Cys-rich protein (TIGR01571 family)
LGRSFVYNGFFLGIVSILLIAAAAGGINGAISVGVIFGVGYTIVNTIYRSQIRDKFNISGSICSDFTVHCCCDSAGAVQEYQEARHYNAPKLDFCSGQPLSEIKESNQSALGRGETGLPLGGTFVSHINSISKTSKCLLGLNLFIAITVITSQFVLKRNLNVALLCLIFLQPSLILYFVYWTKRRTTISLDAVIKLFTVGFYFATFQSICLELLLQLFVGWVLSLITSVSNIMGDSTGGGGFLGHAILMPAQNILSYAVDVLSNVADRKAGFHASWPHQFVQGVLDAAATDPSSSTDAMKREDMKNNIVVVFVAIAIMVGYPHYLYLLSKLILICSYHDAIQAYLIAGGVEETMKYFAVKCCRQLHPLNSPHAVLVCLMTAALGFATAENIEYVFGTPYGTGQSANQAFLGQLFVLLVRLAMPVHIICSVIQAARLSRTILGMSEHTTFGILFPAIVLHGTFDFYLFAINAIVFIYDLDDPYILAASIIGPIVITIAGIVYACITFNRVVAEYDASWTVDPLTGSGSNNSTPRHQQQIQASVPKATIVRPQQTQNPLYADAYIV